MAETRQVWKGAGSQELDMEPLASEINPVSVGGGPVNALVRLSGWFAPMISFKLGTDAGEHLIVMILPTVISELHAIESEFPPKIQPPFPH